MATTTVPISGTFSGTATIDLNALAALVAPLVATTTPPVITPPPVVTPPSAKWDGIVVDSSGNPTAAWPTTQTDNTLAASHGNAADGKPALLFSALVNTGYWIQYPLQKTDGSVPGNGIGVDLTGFTSLQADVIPSKAGFQILAKLFGTGATKYTGSGGGDVVLGAGLTSAVLTAGVATTVSFKLSDLGYNTSVVGYPFIYKMLWAEQGSNAQQTFGVRNVRFV